MEGGEVQSYLGMVRTQHQPPTEEESDVEDPSADDEPEDTGEGEPECYQQHIILVEVAQEAQEPAPLAKDSHADHNAGQVHHVEVSDGLQGQGGSWHNTPHPH